MSDNEPADEHAEYPSTTEMPPVEIPPTDSSEESKDTDQHHWPIDPKIVGSVLAGLAIVATLIGFGIALGDSERTETGGVTTTAAPDSPSTAPVTSSSVLSSTTTSSSTTSTSSTTTTTTTTTEPPAGSGGIEIVDDQLLTLNAADDDVTRATAFGLGPIVQAELVEGATAQPPAVNNLYAQVYATGKQECQWAVMQLNEAGFITVLDNPERHFLVVVEAVGDNEVDLRIYDVRGDIPDDDADPDNQCIQVGVAGPDWAVPQWLQTYVPS